MRSCRSGRRPDRDVLDALTQVRGGRQRAARWVSGDLRAGQPARRRRVGRRDDPPAGQAQAYHAFEGLTEHPARGAGVAIPDRSSRRGVRRNRRRQHEGAGGEPAGRSRGGFDGRGRCLGPRLGSEHGATSSPSSVVTLRALPVVRGDGPTDLALNTNPGRVGTVPAGSGPRRAGAIVGSSSVAALAGTAGSTRPHCGNDPELGRTWLVPPPIWVGPTAAAGWSGPLARKTDLHPAVWTALTLSSHLHRDSRFIFTATHARVKRKCCNRKK